MIITLTKADFSSCKIGTLTTFNVRKSTTIGATVNIIKTSVERAGYSSATTIATIVLDEANYEGHAIKVMMGSTDVSSWYSVGNVIVPANTPITSNITISVSATAINTGGGEVVNPEEPGTGGGSGSGTPETPSDAILLNVNNKTMAKYSRLNVNAYVANMKQIMPKNTIISHIDIALADNTSTDNANAVTSTASLKELSVYVFNAETNLMIETIIDSEPVTSFYSEEFGKHAVRAIINKRYDVPVYFGYDNVQATSTNSIGCAYYSEAGNYLSGTAFDPNTPLSPTSSSVAVLCAIYGELASADNSNYTKIVSYSLDAASTCAANCWVAATKQTIPANTNIGKVAVLAKGDVSGFNMAVVNAETNTLVEYLVTEQSQPSVYSDDAGANVIEFETDKTYTYPVYLIFNAERPTSSNGIQMKSGGVPSGLGILYVDDVEGTMGSPEVGYVFTPSSHYAIGHIIYSKNN